MVGAGISLINSPHKKIKKYICSITLQIISQTDFAYLNAVISQKSIRKVFFFHLVQERIILEGKKFSPVVIVLVHAEKFHGMTLETPLWPQHDPAL